MNPMRTTKATVLKTAPKVMQSINHLVNVLRMFSLDLPTPSLPRSLLLAIPFSKSLLLLRDNLVA